MFPCYSMIYSTWLYLFSNSAESVPWKWVGLPCNFQHNFSSFCEETSSIISEENYKERLSLREGNSNFYFLIYLFLWGVFIYLLATEREWRQIWPRFVSHVVVNSTPTYSAVWKNKYLQPIWTATQLWTEFQREQATKPTRAPNQTHYTQWDKRWYSGSGVPKLMTITCNTDGNRSYFHHLKIKDAW